MSAVWRGAMAINIEANTTMSPSDVAPAQSDYIVILAALFCGFICTIGLALAARCVCFRRRLDISESASTLPVSLPATGLNSKILQLIPTTKYVRDPDNNSERNDCAICLSDFTDGDVMRVLPHCGHVFHVSCIDKWLASSSSCPSCRQLIILVSLCHHCGGYSASQGSCGAEVGLRDIDVLSRQDCAHGFLP